MLYDNLVIQYLVNGNIFIVQTLLMAWLIDYTQHQSRRDHMGWFQIYLANMNSCGWMNIKVFAPRYCLPRLCVYLLIVRLVSTRKLTTLEHRFHYAPTILTPLMFCQREQQQSRFYISLCRSYRQVPNIRRTLVGNQIVDHSDVVGASPVGAAPTTSSFST